MSLCAFACLHFMVLINMVYSWVCVSLYRAAFTLYPSKNLMNLPHKLICYNFHEGHQLNWAEWLRTMENTYTFIKSQYINFNFIIINSTMYITAFNKILTSYTPSVQPILTKTIYNLPLTFASLFLCRPMIWGLYLLEQNINWLQSK